MISLTFGSLGLLFRKAIAGRKLPLKTLCKNVSLQESPVARAVQMH